MRREGGQPLDQMMGSEQKKAYTNAMILAREKACLGERAGAMTEEMFTLKEDEEVHAAQSKLEMMRRRAVERTMSATKDEEDHNAEKEGSKRERGPEPEKYGGKLRVIMVSHDTTDQVTNYRRAPTRKMLPTPFFLPITAMEIPPEGDTISGPPSGEEESVNGGCC